MVAFCQRPVHVSSDRSRFPHPRAGCAEPAHGQWEHWDHSPAEQLGMTAIWHERLDTLREVIRADIARGDYFGAVLTVGRGGEVVFAEALGAQ
jgi:hypothetical protein